MESFEPHSSHTKCISSRRLLPSSTSKDLWSALRLGPVTEVESALLTLKKNGGNVDSRNASGVTPLHIAVWRNHVPIVKMLLAAGADPDARDGESGWSSLHRALHFGHLAVASVLMQAGASLTVEDTKCRTPVDLLSGPVSQVVGNNLDSVVTELYSWGSGTNYQLGTGNAHIQKLPGKVDVLHDSYIKIIAASKFHSIAVGSNGELYTWGFGRGGRLGHPDFDVHSGQAAVITPRLVTSGLGSRRVKAVAAAKHHTIIATDTGDVFSWGSNREGQLGYTSVDTQPTPRRVSFFKVRIVAVAAANKHSAAVAESGEVFTWGCNKEGQLGYGTSNSASNYTPRIVEYLKGKAFKGVAAAKYHTVVLSAEGEVFTWGHRLVNPRRVIITRSLKKCGAALLKFHRTERLHVILVAAGMTYSTALTEDGALFYWASSDPDLRCEQLHSLCGRHVVGISSGKYWTSAVTATGDVYIWDGKKCKSGTSVLTRLPGIKHAISACVGETHLLAVCSLYHPAYLPSFVPSHQPFMPKENNDGLDDIDEEFLFDDIQPIVSETDTQNQNEVCNTVPTLKSLCERVAAEFLVEPRNAIQLLEIADSLEAENLRRYCEDLVVRNFDYIFTVSAPSIGSASLEVLARLEKLLDARSSETWCYRRLPTATATFPAIIYSEEDDKNEIGSHVLPRINRKFASRDFGDFSGESFLQRKTDVDQAILKQVRALRKKLQQIEMLESKLQFGHILDDQQIEKLQTRSAVEIALTELGFPCKVNPALSMSDSSNEKGNKMVNPSKKQRRKSLLNVAHSETAHFNNEMHKEEIMLMGGFSDEKSLVSKSMENMTAELSHESKNVGLCSSNGLIHDSHNNKTVRSVSTKKKNKKGGLSMFLSGALDETPKSIPPPPPKSEGPAWGGAKLEKGLASLRDIQNEQSGTKEASIKPKENREGLIEGMTMAGHVKLSSFLPGDFSSPIPVKLTQAAPASESSDKRAPRWSSSGTSSCRPSLRNIQMQQEKQQQSIIISKSPKSNAPGSSTAPHGSPSELGSSRWFKPEAEALSSIRSIQIEEKAMKDLKRFYSSVRLLKAQPQPL